PWGPHPARLLTAIALVTPAPALFGISAVSWWDRSIAAPIALPWSAAQYGLLSALLLTATAGTAYFLARAGFEALWRDPERLQLALRAARDAVGNRDGGREFYWHGFRNPVWTREIRTRLRS